MGITCEFVCLLFIRGLDLDMTLCMLLYIHNINMRMTEWVLYVKLCIYDSFEYSVIYLCVHVTISYIT